MSMATHTLPPYVNYMRGFSALISLFNLGVIILTLESSVLLMPPSIFWLCWSILVIDGIMLYTIRIYWEWMENTKKSGESEVQCHRDLQVRAPVICLKLSMSIALIVMLFYYNDFRQRQNKMLMFAGLSITLFEGFPQIVVAREELKLPLMVQDMKMARSIIEGHDCKAAVFLIPSAVNVMICVTGAIVLGGKLGSRISDRVYWLVISIFVVDFIAEAIHRFDCGSRFMSSEPIPERMPRRHYIGNVLRVVVGGFLCYRIVKVIFEKSDLSSNILREKACEWQCQESSRSLFKMIDNAMKAAEAKACEIQCHESSRSLLKMIAFLVGIQAAVAFIFPFCSYILQYCSSVEHPAVPSGHRRTPEDPSGHRRTPKAPFLHRRTTKVPVGESHSGESLQNAVGEQGSNMRRRLSSIQNFLIGKFQCHIEQSTVNRSLIHNNKKIIKIYQSTSTD